MDDAKGTERLAPHRATARAASALTPARALRLALSRAAQRAIALPLSVIGVSEEEGPLDDLCPD
jgi:hypothetical protein